MTERPKVTVLKTVGHPCLVGSNPTPSAYGDLDEPYRAVETLANKGLLAIVQALEFGDIGSLSDLLPEVDGLSG